MYVIIISQILIILYAALILIYFFVLQLNIAVQQNNNSAAAPFGEWIVFFYFALHFIIKSTGISMNIRNDCSSIIYVCESIINFLLTLNRIRRFAILQFWAAITFLIHIVALQIAKLLLEIFGKLSELSTM